MAEKIPDPEQLELLAKYLSGQALPKEAMLIEEWLERDANRQAFDEAHAIWQMFEKNRYKKPDPERAWTNLERTGIESKKRSIARSNLVYTVAASFIGLLLLIGSYWINNRKTIAYKGPVADNTSIKRKKLPDGSTVVIRSSSSITYNGDFNKNTRELRLTGEAYFNVAPDHSKPFLIQLAYTKIEVAGTAFNVKTVETGETEVQVESGVVKMYNKNSYQLIRAGQIGIFHKNGQVNIYDSINPNKLAYATGRFVFVNSSFEQFASDLENTFDVEFINKDLYRECHITTSLQSTSLTDILHTVCGQLNLQYIITKNKVRITGDNCKNVTHPPSADQYKVFEFREVNHPLTAKQNELIWAFRNRVPKEVHFYELTWDSMETLNRLLSRSNVQLTVDTAADGRLVFQGIGAKYFFAPAVRDVLIMTKNGKPAYLGTPDNLNILDSVFKTAQ